MADRQLDTKQVMRLLPHRFPMLLVDKVLDWEAGKKIVALKQVSVNEPHFTGHFPGNPIMPGVLIIEALAQACALLAALSTGTDDPIGVKAYLVGVDKARFRAQVAPGASLQLEVALTRSRGGFYQADAKATVGGELACSASLLCYWGK